MSYGNLFRQLRKDKKMTIVTVSSGIMSISMLSKFERDISEITISKFIRLLERIEVSLSEFELMMNEYEKHTIGSLIEELRENYLCRNFEGVKKIVENQLKKWEDTQNIHNKFNFIMLSIVSDDLNNEKKTQQIDVDLLTDYLFSVEKWTYYEIILFGNSMTAINIKSVIMLSNELLKNKCFFQNNETHRRKIIQIIINTIMVCLLNDNLESAVSFHAYVHDFIDTETYLYEKNVLLFYEGLILMKKNKIREGKAKAKKSLDIFRELESSNLVQSYSAYGLELFGRHAFE